MRNAIGFNYRQRTFEITIQGFAENTTREKHAVGNIAESEQQRELYRNFDLWANYFINHDWQLNVNLSFADNYFYRDDSVAYNIAGVGDLTVIVKRFIMNKKSLDDHSISYRWLFGAGLKAPLGSYNKTHLEVPEIETKVGTILGVPEEKLDPHLQAGTGSWDFIWTTEFQLRYGKTGASANLSYRMNTENSNDFRFANRFNVNSTFFHLFKINKAMLAPNLGFNYEFAERDQFQGEAYEDSGGSTLFFSLGAKVYIGNFAFGVNYFNPIHQNLYDHQLQNKNRITTDLTFYI